MSAFNQRFQPWELFGVPLAAIIGLVGLTISVTLTLLLPLPFKLPFALLAILSLVVMIVALKLREELPWLPLKLRHLWEQRCHTQFGPPG